MKPLLTLILRTRCSGSPPLFPVYLLLLSLATGCVTLKEATHTHTETVVSADAESRTLLRDPPGLQRLIGFDADDGSQVSAGKTKVAVDDTENGSSSSQTGFCRLLHQPEEVLASALDEPLLEDQQEPALVQISGYLQEDPLSGIEGDFECTNPSLEEEFGSQPPSLWSRIKQDHTHYYSKESLLWLAGGFGAGAIVANTTLDGAIQDHLQSSLLGASSDEWLETFHAQKELGNGRYTIPIFAAAWGAGLLFEKVPMLNATGEWGERSIRAIIVGTPPMLLMQNVTGASRPGETTANSKWKFFQDDNGVSGHSFMGAIPFLAAAKVTDRPLLKVLFYAGSTLAPISRLNDNRHYPSQAFLGWYMAWIATNAVDATQHADRNWRMFPISWGGNTGIGFEYNW
jgi:hypothetical protein